MSWPTPGVAFGHCPLKGAAPAARRSWFRGARLMTQRMHGDATQLLALEPLN